MGVPAAYIATGVVMAVAALIAIFTMKKKVPQKVRTDGKRDQGTCRRIYTPSPPSSPSSSLAGERGRRCKISDSCINCDKTPYLKIKPCNHESLCNGCAVDYLKTKDTCPSCNGKIDSCFPPIPPFGKCESCRKFTELFKFLPCNHSLSLCIHCFEKKMTSYKKCPVCEQIIRGYEPTYSTSGLCAVCGEFTRFAKFKPCNHGNFCKKHAELYLKLNDQECSECGNTAHM